ncbi:MAG: hypothetical protein FWE21_02380 [Defluviitaleaceae bacterium]|nr:hypothetical protein [Defluviitaleaceae bacterium]
MWVYNYEGNVSSVTGLLIGDFQYPENPAEELRDALNTDVNKRRLPMTISEVESITLDNIKYSQITINFNYSNNVGIILFSNGDMRHNYATMLNGRPNPLFTMAFKDHNRPQDMVMVLTSVINRLSPDLSLEEAERLATIQDITISTDGFSQPLDIVGYQVQARYTNPFAFLQTPNFDAKLGVTVRAIQQLWNGAIDIGNAHLTTGSRDYHLLNLPFWDEEIHPEIVHGDFVVTNTWQYLCWRHGCTHVTVEVESISGAQFSLHLDTWQRFRNPYEFGVGQWYTIFLGLQFDRGIIYAVQRSESMDFNSRGQKQLPDMLSLDFIDSVRVWPRAYRGTIYGVDDNSPSVGRNLSITVAGYNMNI